MRKTLKALGFAFATLALPAAATAQTAEKCMTAAEANSLITFALPDIIEGAVKQCKPHLSPKSYFASSGDSLVARYRTLANPAWPGAKKAMLKLVGDNPMMAMLSGSTADKMMQELLAAGVAQGIGGDIKPGDCGSIDQMTEALAPLPPENTAKLIGLMIAMDSGKRKSGGKKPPFNLCPPAASTVAAK